MSEQRAIPEGHPDAEIVLTEVTLTLCSLCLNGAGGQCHTPGCALWMAAGPDVPLWDHVVLAITDLEDLCPLCEVPESMAAWPPSPSLTPKD